MNVIRKDAIENQETIIRGRVPSRTHDDSSFSRRARLPKNSYRNRLPSKCCITERTSIYDLRQAIAVLRMIQNAPNNTT